jgi:hypothetical protein
MQSKLTLEEVKTEFEQWRRDRKHRHPIPEHLWVMVKKLIGRYKPSKITQDLRLSYSDFKKKVGDTGTTRKKQSMSVTPSSEVDFLTFVPIQPLSLPQPAVTPLAALTAEIKQANGHIITLHAYNEMAITSILAHVMGSVATGGC